MISINKKYLFGLFLILFAVFSVVLFCSDALAQESTGKGRKIWNNIMLFVNFGILVFLFIKYAKNPLMDFLQDERKKMAKRINEVEEQVRKARSLMEAESDKLKSIDKNIGEIRERIIEIGQREKEQIIEKAGNTASQMIEDAENEVQYKIEAARKTFGEEILATAVSMAAENLKKGITEDDNDKIIDQFSAGLAAAKARFD